MHSGGWPITPWASAQETSDHLNTGGFHTEPLATSVLHHLTLPGSEGLYYYGWKDIDSPWNKREPSGAKSCFVMIIMIHADVGYKPCISSETLWNDNFFKASLILLNTTYVFRLWTVAANIWIHEIIPVLSGSLRECKVWPETQFFGSQVIP